MKTILKVIFDKKKKRVSLLDINHKVKSNVGHLYTWSTKYHYS